MSDSFGISRTVAHQATLSIEFPKQEYWNGLPFPFPRDLPIPTQGWNPHPLHWQAVSLPLSQQGSPAMYSCYWMIYINCSNPKVKKKNKHLVFRTCKCLKVPKGLWVLYIFLPSSYKGKLQPQPIAPRLPLWNFPQ